MSLVKSFPQPHLSKASALAAAALVFFLTSGCDTLTGQGINHAQTLKERNPKVQDAPSDEETVRGKDDPPVVTLQMGKSLRPNNLRPSEDMPAGINIGATNLNNVPVTVAMQAVLADTDITVLWETPELQQRKVTLMNLKGPLSKVVDRICRAARVICAYRNGALEMMEKDTFVVEMPGVASNISSSGASSAKNTISESIEALIEGKVKTDEAGGNIIYTTDAQGHERVQNYLAQLRNGRPLIVLQLYIWQVSLDQSRQMGINWKQLDAARLGGVGAANATLSSVSSFKSVAANQGATLGAVLSGAIDSNILAQFLGTQGKVQSISSPQLTFVSGSSAKFEVGGKQSYVAQVGTLLSSSVSGSSTTSGASNNTVSTQELKTGLSINTVGSYENGVVFATLEVKTSDLVKISEVQTSSAKLQLPETSDRTVSTVLRVRPGDNLVLAGLQTSRDTRSRDGLPLPFTDNSLPFFNANDVSNSELVILVKPSVVFFSDRDSLDLQSVKANMPVPAQGTLEDKQVAKEEKPDDKPAKPNELQGEFGTVVKLYENLHAPRTTQSPLQKSPPQNIVPEVKQEEGSP